MGEKDINCEACCTGKYIQQGGIAGRTESTGLGVYYAIRELLGIKSFYDKAGLTQGIKGKTFVVQGLGNVGYWAAKFLQQDGAKIIGIIEYNSAIFNSKGFDVDAVKKHMREKGTLAGYPHVEDSNFENPLDFLQKPCDILLPAAVEKSIHKGNADKLNCKVLLEGANGPTTFAAEEILLKKGVMVCPDLLINGGGVTCSYFEWLKNIDHVSPGKMTKKYQEKSQKKILDLLGYKGTEVLKGAEEIDIVYSGLEEIMQNAVQENWSYSVKHSLTFRDACFVNGIQKVYQCYKECGITV